LHLAQCHLSWVERILSPRWGFDVVNQRNPRLTLWALFCRRNGRWCRAKRTGDSRSESCRVSPKSGPESGHHASTVLPRLASKERTRTWGTIPNTFALSDTGCGNHLSFECRNQRGLPIQLKLVYARCPARLGQCSRGGQDRANSIGRRERHGRFRLGPRAGDTR
jgi:hypothetical protein